MLLIGFAALPIRGMLFASVHDPELLVVVQLLDGMTAAVFGVMVPLVVADLTRGTGHFNLGQGIVGTATGIGASLSATLAGYMSDHFGSALGVRRPRRDRARRPGGAVAADAGDAAGGARIAFRHATAKRRAIQLHGSELRVLRSRSQ